MKKKNSDIRRYTAEELERMILEGKDRTDWKKLDSITEDELERLIAEDPDEAGMEVDWSKARLVMPESKVHVSLRLDSDVLKFFKSKGKGYQTRMNAVLRSYMKAHQKRPGA